MRCGRSKNVRFFERFETRPRLIVAGRFSTRHRLMLMLLRKATAQPPTTQPSLHKALQSINVCEAKRTGSAAQGLRHGLSSRRETLIAVEAIMMLCRVKLTYDSREWIP